jgi:alpha-beta hydrolase superfamily lysophospholipase
VQSQERNLTAADGTSIFAIDWRPEPGETVRGGIVIMHGLGEHCGRYSHVARFFNDLGLTVRAFDHRGHGRSGGPRGDVPNHDSLLQDAKMLVDDFAQQIAGVPFLLGHSMGGLLAARFAVESLSPLRGLILSSPALMVKLTPSQKILFKILTAIAPGFALPNGLDKRYLSHDQTVVDAYATDSLVHAKISARLLGCMLHSIDIAHSRAPGLKLPTLMVIAGDDHIVDASGSQAFYNLLPADVASIHVYPKLYHEIFNETDAGPVFEDVRNWLQARI